MKFAAVLTSLLMTSAVLAAPARRNSNVLASRQAQIKRGLVDVCVALDLDINILDILPGGTFSLLIAAKYLLNNCYRQALDRWSP